MALALAWTGQRLAVGALAITIVMVLGRVGVVTWRMSRADGVRRAIRAGLVVRGHSPWGRWWASHVGVVPSRHRPVGMRLVTIRLTSGVMRRVEVLREVLCFRSLVVSDGSRWGVIVAVPALPTFVGAVSSVLEKIFEVLSDIGVGESGQLGVHEFGGLEGVVHPLFSVGVRKALDDLPEGWRGAHDRWRGRNSSYCEDG